MYNHICGTLVEKTPGRSVVEAGGVGYEIHHSLQTFQALPAAGAQARVFVHLVVTDDNMQLIGFAAQEERAVFRRLISISGLGPSKAVQVLSGITPQEFAMAVDRQDYEALKRIKGIGDKMAKRIVVELKGAKAVLPAGDGAAAGADPAPGSVDAVAAAALEEMGVPHNEAVERVRKARLSSPEATLEQLITSALQQR